MGGNGRDVCIFHGSDRLLSAVFTGNGKFCATGGDGRLATVWDTSCGEAIMKMPPHLSPVTRLAFNSTNTLLASGDADGLVKIWDLKEARLMRNLEGHRLGITCLAFYPNEETVVCASGSKDGRLRLWDIKRKGFFRTFGRKGGAVILSCAFSPDGRLIAVADEESIKVYDVNSEGAPLVNLSCQNPGNVQFHQREMIMVYSTFSGGVIPGNSCVNIFDLETKETTSSVISPSRVESIAFHPVKPVCFALTEDGLKVVGLESNRIYDSVNAPFRRVHSAFALESELLVICDDAKAPGKLMQFDIMKLCLEQPDTPQTAGSSRGIFEQSRPGTMESMYNVDSPFSDDATGAKIEIKDMQKFAALFDKKANVKTAGETYVVPPRQGDLKNLPKVSKSDFNNVMKPQIVQRSMIDIPSSREQRFEEPYRREKSDVSVRSSVPATRPQKSREVPHVPHVRGRGRVDLEKLVDGSIGDILRNRRENLVSACESWPDVESVLDNTIALEDETVLIDILNVINRRINVWNLSMCHKLLSEIKPSLLSLIMSKEESTLETVLDGLCLIGRHFGNIILENLQQAPGALDIQASERYERALTCSNGLRQASSILKSRQATFPPSISSKVRSAIMELKVF